MSDVINDEYVLPADVMIVRVSDLSRSLRNQFEAQDTDFAITRARSRSHSKIVDSDVAALISYFKVPTTLLGAVLAFCKDRSLQADQVLEECFPVLQSLTRHRLLVTKDSPDALKLSASISTGDFVDQFEVIRCLQLLDDTEVYQVKNVLGVLAALKIIRPGVKGRIDRSLQREHEILSILAGLYAPSALGFGKHEERPYLVTEWIAGRLVTSIASQLREQNRFKELLAVVIRVVDAYSWLHEHGVLHGDVHPANIMMQDDGLVRVIDFGLAKLSSRSFGSIVRGGVGPFFEPEYAGAYLRGDKLPSVSEKGEQYSLAALCYMLVTGQTYIQFSAEKKHLFRQIAEEPPNPFSSEQRVNLPGVEEVLRQALHKDPSKRFQCLADFSKMLKLVPQHETSRFANRETSNHSSLSAEGTTSYFYDTWRPTNNAIDSALAKAPSCSLTFGIAGTAYAWHRLSHLRFDTEAMAYADIWLSTAKSRLADSSAFYNREMGITARSVGSVSPFHCESGIHLIQILLSSSMGDFVSAQDACSEFVRCLKHDCQGLDVTLGLSGAVVACALILEAVPPTPLIETNAILSAGEIAFTPVREKIATESIVNSSIELLGMAHGWAGLLFTAIRWTRHSRIRCLGLMDRLDELAALADHCDSGLRWRRKLGSNRGSDDYMAGWCNGSAGLVLLWAEAFESFGMEQYRDLCIRTASHAWSSSEPGLDLCCGLAGRAYALLRTYQVTRDREWLRRAEVLAKRALASTDSVGSRPNSLYKGQLGIRLLPFELEKPLQARMPLFES